MEFIKGNERGKVMSSISSSSKGLRKRRTVRVFAASALVAFAGAVVPAAANADGYFSYYWPDNSRTAAYSGCTAKTSYNLVTRTWHFGAAQNGLNSPSGYGYNPAYVKFAVITQSGMVVGYDTQWRPIPQKATMTSTADFHMGLLVGEISWPYGTGNFAVYATFLHNGVSTPTWYKVGSMKWTWSTLSGWLCFDTTA